MSKGIVFYCDDDAETYCEFVSDNHKLLIYLELIADERIHDNPKKWHGFGEREETLSYRVSSITKLEHISDTFNLEIETLEY